jgi:hypothetical protein
MAIVSCFTSVVQKFNNVLTEHGTDWGRLKDYGISYLYNTQSGLKSFREKERRGGIVIISMG